MPTHGDHTRRGTFDLEAAVLVCAGCVLDDAFEAAAVDPGRYSLTRGNSGADLDNSLDPAPWYEANFCRRGELLGRADGDAGLVPDDEPRFLIMKRERETAIFVRLGGRRRRHIQG